MTIVVHASDCRAIQCKPIDKQSALIVAIRPAQRNMIARLITASFYVNQGCNDDSEPSRISMGIIASEASESIHQQMCHCVESKTKQDRCSSDKGYERITFAIPCAIIGETMHE
jgi:hypothetical protein